MQLKVGEFNASKSEAIKQILVYPLKIGPDRLTVRHNIIIIDNEFTHKIVSELTFPDNPSPPKSLDNVFKYLLPMGMNLIFLSFSDRALEDRL